MNPTSAADIVWYSRLVVLIGAAGLVLEALLQAATGHSVGSITLLCTLALIIGLPVFIVGLVLESRPQTAPEPAVPAPPRATRKPAPAKETPAAAVSIAASPASATFPPVRPAPRVAPAPAAPRRVATRELAEGDTLIGTVCPVCQQRLGSGQLAAACPECSAGHHASCWIDNRFRCGRPGCSGAGGLEAPGSGAAEPTT